MGFARSPRRCARGPWGSAAGADVGWAMARERGAEDCAAHAQRLTLPIARATASFRRFHARPGMADAPASVLAHVIGWRYRRAVGKGEERGGAAARRSKEERRCDWRGSAPW